MSVRGRPQAESTLPKNDGRLFHDPGEAGAQALEQVQPGRIDAPTDRARLGQRAEQIVTERLCDEGYQIVGRNVRVRRYELDLIARRGRTLVVCEVRARRHAAVVHPAQTIDKRKIQRIRRATAEWLSTADLGPVHVRFDVAAVIFDQPGGRLDYYENAF